MAGIIDIESVPLSKCRAICIRDIKHEAGPVATKGDVGWIVPTSIIDDTTKNTDGKYIVYQYVLLTSDRAALLTDDELIKNFELLENTEEEDDSNE